MKRAQRTIYPPAKLDHERLSLSLRHFLSIEGIASGFGMIEAESDLTQVKDADSREFICFARTGTLGLLCLDPSTSTVVHIVGYPPRDNPAAASFVNSTFWKYNEFVDLLVSEYPFYDDDADDETIARVTARIRSELSHVDEPALQRGLFWDEMVEAIRMGDFAPSVVESARSRQRHV